MSVMPTTVTVESILKNNPEKLVSPLGEAITVTGDIYRSSVMPGMIAVEVSFGTLYLADEDDANIMVFM